MKRILILIHVLFCGYICPLLAEDTGAVRYQDSILKVADTHSKRNAAGSAAVEWSLRRDTGADFWR